MEDRGWFGEDGLQRTQYNMCHHHHQQQQLFFWWWWFVLFFGLFCCWHFFVGGKKKYHAREKKFQFNIITVYYVLMHRKTLVAIIKSLTLFTH